VRIRPEMIRSEPSQSIFTGEVEVETLRSKGTAKRGCEAVAEDEDAADPEVPAEGLEGAGQAGDENAERENREAQSGHEGGRSPSSSGRDGICYRSA